MRSDLLSSGLGSALHVDRQTGIEGEKPPERVEDLPGPVVVGLGLELEQAVVLPFRTPVGD
jgi:hypothetical protein